MEARAIVDLLVYFNWTYISTVFSEDSYGQSGTNDLVEFAEKYGICIDLRRGISEYFEEYDSLALELVESEAKVVVLYASSQMVQKLLEAVSRTPGNRNLTWIATSAWAQSTSILRQFDSTVAGMFGTIPLFRSVEEFNDYYSELTPMNNVRNAWFGDFMSALNTTNCTANSNSSECSAVDDRDYAMEYAIPLVIDAVYTFAYALQDFFEENCDLPIIWNSTQRMCNGQQRELDGPILLEYIQNATFVSPSGNTVRFDEDGSVEAIYEILNYQARKSEDGETIDFDLVTIANWDAIVALNGNESTALKFNTSVSPQFGLDDTTSLIDRPAPSECGKCPAGKYLRMIPSSCCGLCESCLGELYSNSSQAPECLNCSEFGEFWGDIPLIGSSDCVEIPTVFLRFSHPWSVITIIIALFGLLFVVFVVGVYAKYWGTPVVKSSSRENMVILLTGIVLSFITSLFYLSPPSIPICVFQRTLLWLCFSMIFSTLTLKTVRIARLFVFQKNSLTKLRFMETKYQILFTIVLIVFQMVIVFGSLVGEFPLVRREIRLNREDANDLPQVVITCEPDPLVVLVISVCYETGLLIITTVLGTLSFKYPANFNEARSICCAAFALLAIWAGFFPAYFATKEIQEFQNAVIAFSVVLSGFAVLVCLFGPRVYILLFWKERNTKGHSRRPTENDLPEVSAFQTVTDTLEHSEFEGMFPPSLPPSPPSLPPLYMYM